MYSIDETGKVYGKLTVIGYDKEKRRWKCQCECGNIKYHEGRNLRQNKFHSCGCLLGKYNESKREELTGQKFGKLTVVKYDKKKRLWLCQCDCGNITYADRTKLKAGERCSCGCVHNNKYKDIRNDKRFSKLYGVWNKMKDRCINKNNPNYCYYGAKGIKVCDEWTGKEGFNNFFNWAILNGYQIVEGEWNDKLSIDRIDSNKDYCPENCRWISMFENVARSGKHEYKLEKKVIELNNKTDDELVQEYIQRKTEMLENNTLKKGTFFYRKPNYCYLHNVDNTKQYLFRNYRSVAVLLDISYSSVGYRIRKKNGVVADGWRLEKINKESFDELKNKGIEVIR